MRHVLTHLAVAVIGVGVAALAGVPVATALPIALVASCAVMMLTMGAHAGHDHPPAEHDQRHRAVPPGFREGRPPQT